MPQPLGPQWVKLYRGLYDAVHDDVAYDIQRPIGQHWTPNYGVARMFAQYGTTTPRRHAADDSYGGTVVEALVHRRHVIGKDDPEAVQAGVYPEWHPGAEREDEVTVRQGSPVHLRKSIEIPAPHDEHEGDEDEYDDRVIEMPMGRKSVRRA